MQQSAYQSNTFLFGGEKLREKLSPPNKPLYEAVLDGFYRNG
jgi:hypothetical protein